MNDDTIYMANAGRLMRGVAIAGAIAMVAGVAMVVGGGMVLFKLLR